jgi:predicted O-methyltransferase YrrM
MEASRNIEIKNYICKNIIKNSADLTAAKQHALKNNLPAMEVPENIGMLLYLLTKLRQPQRILEIGTLSGCSTMWLAKGAPYAKIITLERNAKHAQVARENFERSSDTQHIQIIEGDAFDTLKHFIEHEEPPFDLIFLDADKAAYAHYLPLLLTLSKSGTLLLSDNLIPKDGQINNPEKKRAIGVYQFNELLISNPHIETTFIPTLVGDQGRVDALGISLIIQ